MSIRIAPIDPAHARGQAKELLTGVQSVLGMTPNVMRTMAHSPAALEGYLALNGALAKGALSAAVRERIAVAVAQRNGCEYCLSAHTALGKRAGLNDDQLRSARGGQSGDAKTRAILKLTLAIMDTRGSVTDEELAAARAAGIDDGEIAEIVGHVGVNVLTNYFNQLAGTEIDFPRVPLNVEVYA